TGPGAALAPVPLTVRVLALALRVAALAAGIARRLHRLGQVAHQLAEILGQRHRFGPGPRHALDVAHISAFVGGDEADRLALGAGARGAADAVDILFRDVRNLEVDH